MDKLVLGIQDAAFPSEAADDTGRGSPYSPCGLGLLRFARDLGFDGLQLGPQGETSEGDASPYSGTLLSRCTLSISLLRLARDPEWLGLLPAERLETLVERRPSGAATRVPYGYVHRAHGEALGSTFAAFISRRERSASGTARLSERFEAFKRDAEGWLERDALYEAVRLEHPFGWQGASAEDLDGGLWQPAPGEEKACGQRRTQLRALYGSLLEFYRFKQFVAHAQHRHLRDTARALGLRLYGDLQIGLSDRDVWSHRSLFLPHYRLGAPPSRTNPEGQPWGYAVLHPEYYGEISRPGPVLRFLATRMDKFLSEYDGVRIDHPHGLVCPWVYRSDLRDPAEAVQQGARLFASPDLPDHAALTRFAIAGRPDLNADPSALRHGDDWVACLRPEQIERYAVLLDAVVDALRRHGRSPSDLACEVLSTQPYPLQRVLQRHGLGRFRVTQKADLNNAADVYRSENAEPRDWIMLGNHDTKPIWLLLEEWELAEQLPERAKYLAGRLEPVARLRSAFAERLARTPGLLAQAELANLFVSRAGHVMIFFTDLFGFRETYNQPGTVSEDNWSLRLPKDYRRVYEARKARKGALDLPLALAMALRARGTGAAAYLEALIRELDPQGGIPRGGD